MEVAERAEFVGGARPPGRHSGRWSPGSSATLDSRREQAYAGNCGARAIAIRPGGATDAVTLPGDPPEAALRWVAESLGGGSHVRSVQRLAEGHWHANHVVTVRDARGLERDLVLRRWVRPEWRADDPDFTPRREADVLELVAAAPLATPTVIAVDDDGRACDVPAILTDRLPGSPPALPPAIDSFVEQLAEALAAIQSVDESGASQLPAYRRYFEPHEIEVPAWSSRPELWGRALEVAAGEAPEGRLGFIHRDYGPYAVEPRAGARTGRC